jgi:hypothetical protein
VFVIKTTHITGTVFLLFWVAVPRHAVMLSVRCMQVCNNLFGGVDGLDLEVMFCHAVQTELFRATQETATPGEPTAAAVALAQPSVCSSTSVMGLCLYMSLAAHANST